MAEPALRLRGVRAGYGATVVLDGVDLDIARGESVSILGRNGVGKSTLLATLMGHTTLHAGTLAIDGRDLAAMRTHRRARAGLGYVPQEREVFPSLTVVENLAVANRGGQWSVERVFETFPRLAARRTHRGVELSGGEQQMLAIARALMGDPRVLLMDEPSEGLAPIIVEQLMSTITRLRDETALTIALVEQHVEAALAFAPRTLVMERGRIVHDGPSAELGRDEARMAALVGIARR